MSFSGHLDQDLRILPICAAVTPYFGLKKAFGLLDGLVFWSIE
jgi:hypothetical protein